MKDLYIALFVTTISVMLAILCTIISFQEHFRALDSMRAYDSALESLEAYQRTTGRHIDSAYVCKTRSK